MHSVLLIMRPMRQGRLVMKAVKAAAYPKWRKKVLFLFHFFNLIYYFFTVFLYISDSQQQIFWKNLLETQKKLREIKLFR